MPKSKLQPVSTSEKRGRGRPTVYRPEFCERVIEMGKNGYSIASMASELDVDKATILRWRDEHEEFRTALSKALVHAQHWWERTGVLGMLEGGKGFNALVWKVSMQARFREDYTERKVQEVTGANGGPVQSVVEQRATIDATQLTPEQRDVLRAALISAKKP